MEWFYVYDSLQHGPVSDAQLHELIRTGKVRQDTLVWREGMVAWQALATARPPSPPQIAGQSLVPCAECGRHFASSDVIMLNNLWICGGCKPLFLQRLREGVLTAGVMSGLWRVKNVLVTRNATPFPDQCVRCNAPANGYRLKREFSWHPLAYFLFVFLSIPVYIIVALCVRRKAVLHVGLCEAHRVRRRNGIVACCVGLFGGIGLIIGGAVAESGIVALIGVLAFFAGTIWGVSTGLGISVTKIDKDYVWIKGVNKDFLAQLPEWNGPTKV